MNRCLFFNRAAGATILLLFSSGAWVKAQGLLYTVNSTGDGGNVGSSSICDDGTDHCTLRAALEAANAHPGTDGIRFSIPVSDPGYNGLFWTINLTRALPDVSDSIGIVGPGANLLTVRRNTGGEYRIFNVTTAGTVTFSRLTISNGLVGGETTGGGIRNLRDGTVNVTNCTLNGNRAGFGGGIDNFGTGTVNVTNCTLSDNRAVDFGGGIGNLGIVTVLGSTISGNSALSGGGIYNGGTVNVTNSTISGNFGNTVVGGTAGGIHSSNISTGTATVKSSIIALNTGTHPDVRGSFASEGFNLIGKTDGSTGFTRSTDQAGTVASPLDPKLDPNGLQDNGGPTKTVALRSDSPAIDAGTSVGLSGPLATDQRGAAFPRTIDFHSAANAAGGDGTDIGAFEFPMLKMGSVTKLPSGHILLQGVGIPNRLHTIQASRNLGPSSFIEIGHPTADQTGALQYDDAAALILEQRFYRLTFP